MSNWPKDYLEGTGQPTCPHCGGLHFGQRFDACPYVKLASDASATEEQRRNAKEWLRLHKARVI